MNEKQKTFIEDSMIGDIQCAPTSKHDELDQVRMALESIIISAKRHRGTEPFNSIECDASDALRELEKYEARLKATPLEMVISQDIRTDPSPERIAHAIFDALEPLTEIRTEFVSNEPEQYEETFDHPFVVTARAELQRYLTSPDLRAIDLDDLTARLETGPWEVDVVVERSGEELTWGSFATTVYGGEQTHGWSSIGAILAHYAHRPVTEDGDQ